MNNDRRAALCRVYVSSVFVHEARLNKGDLGPSRGTATPK